MASKLEKLTYGSDYSLAVEVDENGKKSKTIVVLDRFGKPSKQVANGALQDNSYNVNCDYNGFTASDFKNGLASISFTTPEYGQGLMYGGDDRTVFLTRSGYPIDSRSELAEKAQNAYANPGELTRIKWRDGNSNYAYEYKVLLDVAQHSFESKGRELEQKYGMHRYSIAEAEYTEKQYASDLKELEKLAKKVVGHLAKELEKANKGNNKVAIKNRLNALTSPEAALAAELGGN